MGEFVEEATETVHPAKEPTRSWPVYGVSNRAGVELSHFQLGESFNSAYKRIQRDWFFHNPTRANVGSLGRVPDVPADAITSPEYQVWRIKRHLLPEFVEILIRQPFFLDLIECHRVGAVKERLFVDNLCEIPIPVLSDRDQKQVINLWHEHQRKVDEAKTRIAALEKDTDSEFFDQLGLTSPDAIARAKALSVGWNTFDRWGVRFNQLRQGGADITQGKYPVVELDSVLELVQYGTSEKANTDGIGVPVLRIGNVKGRALDLDDLKHVTLPQRTLESLLLSEGDVLVIRTSGSRDLVGTCAVFDVAGEFVFASYLIRLRFCEFSKL
jgi:type I restriction enzyme, S subunit